MKNFMICLLNAALLVCGQLLFKFGTHRKEIASFHDILKLLLSPYMMIATAFYIAATLLWVYILTKVPISYAYPIQAIAFPLVMFMSVILFQESVSINRWIGVAVIMIGILLVSK